MSATPPPAPLPPGVRLLQWLVIVLTLTLIGGVIVTVAALVTRLPGSTRTSVTIPDHLVLPEGVSAQAVTFGPGWSAVVSDDGRILIFDSESGRLRKQVEINNPD